MQVKLDRKAVLQLFAENSKAGDIAVALFRMVTPNFDKVADMNHYPRVNRTTGLELFRLFGELDKRTRKEGGSLLWMNLGFSSCEGNEHLRDWVVELDEEQIQYMQAGEP